MARHPRHSLFDLAAGLGLAGLHTGATLCYRLPMLAAFAPTARARAEMARMVNEKVAAAVEGALDGQAEAMRLTRAALTGRLNPADAAGAPAAIAAASLKPAFRRVKANTRRLRRRRSPG